MREKVAIAGSGAIATGWRRPSPPITGMSCWSPDRRSRPSARASGRRSCSSGWSRATARSGRDGPRARWPTPPIVVEAIAEELDAKARAARRARRASWRRSAILATTTSSLSVEELAAASGRPERFVGLHVFNPVPRMELVELVFPPRRRRRRARARARPVRATSARPRSRCPTRPGFVVNRLLFPYLFDAVSFMEEPRPGARGRRPLHDARRRPPDGPARAAGLRRPRRRRSRSASRSAPRSPRACASWPPTGALGKKAGRGFYDYDAILRKR